MMINTVDTRITLDLYSSCYKVVKAQQGDMKSRYIYITLLNNGVAYNIENDCTVRLAGKRPDNGQILDDCTVTNNVIKCELTDYILAIAGVVKLKICIYHSATNALLSSVPFELNVDKNPLDESVVIASPQFSALTNALNSVDGYINQMTSLIGEVNELKATIEETNDNVNNTLSDVNTAIDSITELENNIESAETNRVNAESSRVSAESSRVSAEESRVTAETQRNTDLANAISNMESQTNTAITNVNTAITNADTATTRANNAAKACEDLAGGNLPIATDTSIGAVKGSSDIHIEDDGSLTLVGDIGNAQTVNGHTVECDVPADAVFTDTVPESLPANGGNADTVDGKHASDFMQRSLSQNTLEFDSNTTQEDLDNQIKNFVDSLPDVNLTPIRLSVNVNDISISSGSWEGFILKTTSDYWCLHLTRYGGMCLIYSYERGNVSVKKLNNIANNLTTTEEGFALDARQGVYLNNLIEKKATIKSGTFSGTTDSNGNVVIVEQSIKVISVEIDQDYLPTSFVSPVTHYTYINVKDFSGATLSVGTTINGTYYYVE